MTLSLSTLSLLLGVGMGLPQVWQLLKPEQWRRWSAGFPRSKPIGYVLIMLATVWFLWNVKNETLADFTKYKPFLLAGFAAVGVLTCIYVSDFLAARGFALLLLLMAKVMVDVARWHDSEWRWIISGLAYVWVIAGIWFTISPWRLRDFLAWQNANEKRLRLLAGARLGLALLLVILAFTAFPAR
jgi:hypothetical protein